MWKNPSGYGLKKKLKGEKQNTKKGGEGQRGRSARMGRKNGLEGRP